MSACPPDLARPPSPGIGNISPQAFGVEAPRAEWGVALRACEHLLEQVGDGTRAPASLGGARLGATALHLSMVEVEGEEARDLLDGAAPLRSQRDAWPPGTSPAAAALQGCGSEEAVVPSLFGAKQVLIDNLADSAKALSVGSKARPWSGAPLAPRTHVFVSLAVRLSGGGGGSGAGGLGRGGVGGDGGLGGSRTSRLLLVLLAGGEALKPYIPNARPSGANVQPVTALVPAMRPQQLKRAMA